MHIEHVALWTHRLEPLRAFYERYLGAHAGARYDSRTHPFSSYFLRFDGGARLELMQLPGVADPPRDLSREVTGYQHLAVAVGAEAEVDALTSRLAADGHRVLSPPRRTGDGYYESVVLDPDGNRVELVAERP